MAMLKLAGGGVLTDETAAEFARSKGGALAVHCAALEAEHNVQELRQLLLALIDLGLEICDGESCVTCNNRYGGAEDLKRGRITEAARFICRSLSAAAALGALWRRRGC